MSEYENDYLEEEYTYGKGFLGALIGALIAAAALAVVYQQTWFSIGLCVVGLANGVLVAFGYDMFKGKQEKARLVIVILVAVLGMFLGMAAGFCWSIADQLQSKGQSLEYFGSVVSAIFQDENQVTMMLMELGQGLVYSVAGVVGHMLYKKS